MNNQPKSHPLAALSADELLEHAAWLRSFAGALVRDPNEADDLVQGAFGAAVTAPSAVRDLRGYLAGTVRWLAWKDRRAHVRRRDRDTAHARDATRTAPPADEPLEVMDMMRVVLEEVGKLPKTQGRAISLHFVEQLSPNEIAQREGTSASTVRSNLARGLRTLRERLDERNGDRASWCTVLAPFSLPAPVGVAAAGIESPALGATAPATVVTSASVLVSLMSLKLATLVAVPLALAATWYMVHDTDVDPLSPAVRANTTVGRAEAANVDRRMSVDTDDLDVVAASGSRAVAVDATTPRRPDGALVLYPLQGRILDRETREGIPGLYVTLGVMDEATHEVFELVNATTGVDGAYEVEGRSIAAGAVRIEVLERAGSMRGSLIVPMELDFPFEIPLTIAIGPTFRFDYQRIDEQYVARFEVQASGPGIHAKRPPSAHMRPGVDPWVRFDDPLADAETVGPWELRVLSSDGLRVGTGIVHRRVGIEPSLVPITFEWKGAILFVLPPDARQASPFALVQVSNEDGFELDVELSEQPDGSRSGHVRFLEPGAYSWSMPADTGAAAHDVQVASGETVVIELERPAAGASVRVGILDATAAAGANLSDWECMVFDPGNLEHRFEPRPERALSLGPDMWTVPLGAVPSSGWMMAFKPKEGFEVDHLAVSVDETGPTPRIRVSRSAAPVSVDLVAVDAGSGERLLFTRAVHIDGMDFNSVHLDADGGFDPITVSATRGSAFLLRKDGYELTESRFEPGRDDSTHRVRLEKGWRNRVVVVDASNMSFLPGVSVHIDGELAGSTGNDGALWFSGDGPPKLIEVAVESKHLEVAMSPFERAERGPGDPLAGYLFLVRERK